MSHEGAKSILVMFLHKYLDERSLMHTVLSLSLLLHFVPVYEDKAGLP